MQTYCDGCPYQKELKAILDKPHNDDWHCPILDDAIALLKEQDPVEPELEGGGSNWWYVCGECHGTIYNSDNFCKHCGRRIKHEKKAK